MTTLTKTTALLMTLVVLAATSVYFLWPERGDSPPEALPSPEPELQAQFADSALGSEPYDPGQAGFAVEVEDVVIPYEIFGIYTLPGRDVRIDAVEHVAGHEVQIDADAGQIAPVDASTWTWTAPEEPGLYRIDVTVPEAEEGIRLNAFVKVPFDPSQRELNGYQIGQYMLEPYKGNPVYDPPQGMVELRPELLQARVSPHFTLGQFVAKQESDYPKYLLLREQLLLKLEMLLRRVREAGAPAQTLHVMSAYRTPAYNRSIGNETSYSRHLYGGAADIFVDIDGDQVMDDLNGDGEISRADASVIAGIIEEARESPWYTPLIGGMGLYGSALPRRGPFVHVDVRGEPVRW